MFISFRKPCVKCDIGINTSSVSEAHNHLITSVSGNYFLSLKLITTIENVKY